MARDSKLGVCVWLCLCVCVCVCVCVCMCVCMCVCVCLCVCLGAAAPAPASKRTPVCPELQSGTTHRYLTQRLKQHRQSWQAQNSALSGGLPRWASAVRVCT